MPSPTICSDWSCATWARRPPACPRPKPRRARACASARTTRWPTPSSDRSCSTRAGRARRSRCSRTPAPGTPADPKLLLVLARAYGRAGKPLPRRPGPPPSARSLLADRAARRRCWRTQAGRSPQDIGLHRRLAALYARLGRPDQAKQEADTARLLLQDPAGNDAAAERPVRRRAKGARPVTSALQLFFIFLSSLQGTLSISSLGTAGRPWNERFQSGYVPQAVRAGDCSGV